MANVGNRYAAYDSARRTFDRPTVGDSRSHILRVRGAMHQAHLVDQFCLYYKISMTTVLFTRLYLHFGMSYPLTRCTQSIGYVCETASIKLQHSHQVHVVDRLCPRHSTSTTTVQGYGSLSPCPVLQYYTPDASRQLVSLALLITVASRNV